MWFHTIEFYVISAVVAAAIIAFAVRPPRRGPAITRILGPVLLPDSSDEEPALIIDCDEHADITITRTGINGIADIKLAVTVVGYDIRIDESAVADPTSLNSYAAVARLDFLGRERYHLSYSAPWQSRFSSMQFTIRPGLHIVKPLTVS